MDWPSPPRAGRPRARSPVRRGTAVAIDPRNQAGRTRMQVECALNAPSPVREAGNSVSCNDSAPPPIVYRTPNRNRNGNGNCDSDSKSDGCVRGRTSRPSSGSHRGWMRLSAPPARRRWHYSGGTFPCRPPISWTRQSVEPPIVPSLGVVDCPCFWCWRPTPEPRACLLR